MVRGLPVEAALAGNRQRRPLQTLVQPDGFSDDVSAPGDACAKKGNKASSHASGRAAARNVRNVDAKVAAHKVGHVPERAVKLRDIVR